MNLRISWKRTLATTALAVLLGSSSASSWSRADTIWVSSGGSPLPIEDVKIARVVGDRIFFMTAQGTETSRELGQVSRMKIDDEPVFTAAEDAFAAGDFDKATDGYQKAMKGSAKEWLKDWATLRLIESANKAGRFDAAASGYIALVQKDPNLAARQKPQMPDAGSTYLETAAEDANKALQNSRLSEQQQLALLNFLLEIHRTRNDTAAAGQVAEQMAKLGGGAGAGGEAQAPVGAVADMKLGLAKVALDNKEYDKALKEIEDNRAIFTDPKQQADALYVIAEAKNGLLGSSDDPEALKDVALAYMRVVAHFKDQPNAPHVAESLFKTAQVMERLKDERSAVALYQQLANEYAESPLATKAKEQVERLRGS